MSSRRAPSAPPQLAGFTYVEPLGSGGFADVFLYEQQMPKRRVAVKVLLTERLGTAAATEFATEANVMAMLSTHPAIVTIYQAGVSDDGRPYLVMEYCPRPNLQARYRAKAFSVTESLRVGVQVAAAVETAHRAGVLHRDIKPANILVTEYNRPALTDFGIASTTASSTEAAGMSIPWSPPESFADVPQSGPRSDVYALGATVYTLLAGRSPFEIPGERNTSAELMERIERMPLPALGRADVPASLQLVLERAMAKRPDDRYPTAVAFARALHKVQIELSHSVTPIDIIEEHPAHEAPEDDDGGLTRVRNVVSIESEATRPSATTSPVVPVDTTIAQTVRRPTPVAPVHDTAPAQPVHSAAPLPRASDSSAPDPHAAPADNADNAGHAGPSRGRRRWWPLAAAAGVLVVAGIAVALALSGVFDPADPEAVPDPSPTSRPVAGVVTSVVPQVEGLTGAATNGGVVFTWTNPDPQEGDFYLWGIPRPGQPTEVERSAETTVTVAPEAGGTTCIEVTLVRESGRAAEAPVVGCVHRESAHRLSIEGSEIARLRHADEHRTEEQPYLPVRTLTVGYWYTVPGTKQVTVATFSTPMADIANLMLDYFDAIVAASYWA